ncbi:outer dense fiber protein 3-like [Melopsittacus undulatus]|uniref:outer dense fiber protein 3-like n=1 Tax=Melopsittacus undulatus TaxID=13146 RepID=UPI00146AD031|nr:outer dense fiber protein 3-like [Melopsittacus undulatus]
MSDSPWVCSWRPHCPRGPITALYISPGPKYGLPSSISFLAHAPCRPRAPGAAAAAGPGPRVPGALGQHRPRQLPEPPSSICGRPRDPLPFSTPGPGRYLVQPHGPRLLPEPPHPARGRAADTSTVGTFYEDLCKNPGPGRYHTVDTDVYKHRAPRFSMVVRNMPPGDTTTKPGPAAYSPRQSRPQGVTFDIRHSEYLTPLIVDVPD